MEESTSKEKVLKAVREAIISKTDQPFPKIDFDRPVYRDPEDPDDVSFAQELNAAGGLFVYCESEREAVEGLKYLIKDRNWDSLVTFEPWLADMLEKNDIPAIHDPLKLTPSGPGITGCEFLVARLGSVMVSTGQGAGRKIFIFPEIHIVLAYTSQLVHDLKDAIMRLRKKYDQDMPSMVTFITGPSRTADIEKTLVMGAHGPKELFVFLIEDRL